MLKFLIIVSLTVYVISKIGGFFFRAGISSQQRTQQRRPNDGNVNVPPQKARTPRNVKGGEYVDYEEVK